MITIVVYCHIGVYATPQWGKIGMTTSFYTIIIDNSHDPKNGDGQASAVHLDVDSPVQYKMCYGVQVIFYIFLLNI